MKKIVAGERYRESKSNTDFWLLNNFLEKANYIGGYSPF
jgi:hypothetical protein